MKDRGRERIQILRYENDCPTQGKQPGSEEEPTVKADPRGTEQGIKDSLIGLVGEDDDSGNQREVHDLANGRIMAAFQEYLAKLESEPGQDRKNQSVHNCMDQCGRKNRPV